jgi:hypothetical protein
MLRDVAKATGSLARPVRIGLDNLKHEMRQMIVHLQYSTGGMRSAYLSVLRFRKSVDSSVMDVHPFSLTVLKARNR